MTTRIFKSARRWRVRWADHCCCGFMICDCYEDAADFADGIGGAE